MASATTASHSCFVRWNRGTTWLPGVTAAGVRRSGSGIPTIPTSDHVFDKLFSNLQANKRPRWDALPWNLS
ncbi:hypothetical protein Hypma_015461 [Hypsizygus marmoreus]|uniref:Uncharacterized protein n=1 Tax=Hypsizygus marmoreus TaxID=39966 RepID=A0A369K3I4_HYPMA|nr:hypothetical protein Hypma_015461 [Hypsizygus marmoreus]